MDSNCSECGLLVGNAVPFQNRKDLTKIARRTKETLKEYDRILRMELFLRADFTIYKRLLYKNTNQHRNTLYFRKSVVVRRIVLKLLRSENNFLLSIPCRHFVEDCFDPLEAAKQVIQTGLPEIMQCFALYRIELEMEHFVPLSIAMMALLSRIYTIFTNFCVVMEKLTGEIRDLKCNLTLLGELLKITVKSYHF